MEELLKDSAAIQNTEVIKSIALAFHTVRCQHKKWDLWVKSTYNVNGHSSVCVGGTIN